MKILLYGSIAAGKTSLAKKIITQHENFQYLSIDNLEGNTAMAHGKMKESLKEDLLMRFQKTLFKLLKPQVLVI
jgi:adenylate kinase family enzyme